ncbi:MAG TPA: hypothetical protein VF796_03960, partial [Humisphaera sp.]
MKLPHLAAAAVLVVSFACPALAAWKPALEMDGQVFPSLLIATANIKTPEDAEDEKDETFIGDPKGIVGVEVESPADNATVTVSVRVDRIAEPATITAKLPKKGETYRVYPTFRYDYKVLRETRQAAPLSVTIEVRLAGRPAERKDLTVSLRSINECPFAELVEGDGDAEPTVDVYAWMFAAYVNEDHPLVDKILKEALATGAVKHFTGYQAGDVEEVHRQVFAVWHALQARGIRYSDVSTTANASETVHSQHVRFLDEALENGQANCVDGSVVFASVLRKIGLEPALVIVPGHCYLAYYGDAGRKQVFGLETTLIGETDLAKLKVTSGSAAGALAAKRNEASFKSFVAAVGVGTENLTKAAKKFDDEDEADYQIIPIADARK